MVHVSRNPPSWLKVSDQILIPRSRAAQLEEALPSPPRPGSPGDREETKSLKLHLVLGYAPPASLTSSSQPCLALLFPAHPHTWPFVSVSTSFNR